MLVVLPSYDDAQIAACIRAGAVQCLIEPVSDELCLAAIEQARAARVQEGLEALDPQLVDEVAISFRTPSEAEAAARLLSSFCPQPARQSLGISELLLNAVEHGNLEIGGLQKAFLLEEGLLAQEISLRLRDPRFSGRRAQVVFRRHAEHIEICCQDQGPGFDWRRALGPSLEDVQTPRGRGIALSRKLAFDSLDYFERGNRVAARVALDRPIESIPVSRRADAAPGQQRIFDELSDGERSYIAGEAQQILELGVNEQVFHTEALLAARLLGAKKSCIGLVNSDGRFLVCTCDGSGQRDVLLFDSLEELPELWRRAYAAEASLLVNEPLEVGPLGYLRQSVLTPMRYGLSTIGFLHVAENGSEWSRRDALRLEVLAARFAPVLSARLRADSAERARAMVAREHARSLEDREAARFLVGCLVREGCMAEPGIRMRMTSLELFNGDIALGGRLPGGGLRWMLGDFVGHGLSAAIGGIPLASIFYATTNKGVPLAEVACTMNETLRGVLPPGYFCAAILLEIEDGQLRCWNGGMPPAFLRDHGSSRVREFSSSGLPLGIAGADLFSAEVEQAAVQDGDRVLCYSDGVIETQNPAGVLFGVERAMHAFSVVAAASAFDHLTERLEHFRETANAADDLSIVEVTVGVADRPIQSS
ncbi:MAG: SpoIIE family protein phosphatase [Polyangiaceae bacterium]